MPKTNLQQQIFIDALPSKVWKVLTNSRYTTQYLTEGAVESQWTEGSALTLITQRNDSPDQIIQKGKILEVIPGVLLKYHLQELNSTQIITTAFELVPAEEGIELKFYLEDLSGSAGDYLFKVQQAKLLLQKIKWLAEYA